MAELDNASHEKFAVEYLIDYNATAAGVRCGYSETYGRDLLRNPAVKARIAELRDELTERTQITAERIARSYAEIAFYDGRDMARVLDALAHEHAISDAYELSNGLGTPGLADRLSELPRAVTAPIRKLSKRVDNKGTTYTVEAYDRHKALDVLADRYWSPDEAHDGMVESIRAMRASGVPDMSEDNSKHVDDDASHVALDDIPDTANTDEDTTKAKWRRP